MNQTQDLHVHTSHIVSNGQPGNVLADYDTGEKTVEEIGTIHLE